MVLILLDVRIVMTVETGTGNLVKSYYYWLKGYWEPFHIIVVWVSDSH